MGKVRLYGSFANSTGLMCAFYPHLQMFHLENLQHAQSYLTLCDDSSEVYQLGTIYWVLLGWKIRDFTALMLRWPIWSLKK